MKGLAGTRRVVLARQLTVCWLATSSYSAMRLKSSRARLPAEGNGIHTDRVPPSNAKAPRPGGAGRLNWLTNYLVVHLGTVAAAGPPDGAAFFSGISAIMASAVSIKPAIEAACCRAERWWCRPLGAAQIPRGARLPTSHPYLPCSACRSRCRCPRASPCGDRRGPEPSPRKRSACRRRLFTTRVANASRCRESGPVDRDSMAAYVASRPPSHPRS